MNRAVRHLRILAGLALVFCASAVGLAAASADSADSAQAKAKLAAVRARIATLTERLGVELKQRDALSARLREADLQVTATRRRLDGLRAAELSVARRRNELRAEQIRTRNALESERAALAIQVRAAYMIGHQEQIRLLLNQADPVEVGRMLTFYGYFARARGAKIDEIGSHVARLKELVGDIEQTAANLKSLEDDASREVAGLQRARAERALALAALSQQVKSGNQELQQLKREEQAVESLVADLNRVLQDFPVDTQQPFDQLRGKLPWPVSGRLTARYQEPRANAAQSGMRWNGVMIESARGAKVRAPYFGRVVYADWLQGLGLLLIIGHSGNYMTLYGHAEVLYKSVGDWVAPGDVIAALSDAGAAAPQLYFEIRDGRKPVDPKIWLTANP
ncbi:MAG: murein hydrolase activator EnvC family protein [Steroidobacteraceae bacterium]